VLLSTFGSRGDAEPVVGVGCCQLGRPVWRVVPRSARDPGLALPARPLNLVKTRVFFGCLLIPF
jgi:hypothetical protein